MTQLERTLLIALRQAQAALPAAAAAADCNLPVELVKLVDDAVAAGTAVEQAEAHDLARFRAAGFGVIEGGPKA